MGTAQWSELFVKHEFFHKYRYYLQVIASTGNQDLQLKWYLISYSHVLMLTLRSNRAGTVESRIRQLVMKLEFVESLTLAHPFIKGFDQCFYCLSDDEVRAVAQGDVSEVILRRKKEDVEGKDNLSTVYTTTFYIGLAIEPKQRQHSTSFSAVMGLIISAFSRRYWAATVRHLLSHNRVHQTCENLG